MTGVSAALAVWRSRGARTASERAFVVYAIVMVSLVAVVPLARAMWLASTSPSAIAALSAPGAPAAAMLVTTALWAAALLLGRDRGPALRPPFLTYALANGGLSRWAAFRGAVLRAASLTTLATAAAAALVGGALLTHGLAQPLEAVAFAASGVLVGVIATVAWLAGQAFPRAAPTAALAVLAAGVGTLAAPVLRPITPWGEVALLYPDNGAAVASPLLLAAAIAGAAATPAMVNRLSLADLVAQAMRWDQAMQSVAGMELSSAVTVYQQRPRVGRGIPAVLAAGGLARRFALRGLIGAVRTPGRSAGGVLTLGAAGALLALGLASGDPGAPAWPWGAAAGVLAFIGLGPLTDGIRHAAQVASDLPLYGVSDERLLGAHTIFPLVAGLVVVGGAALVTAVALAASSAVLAASAALLLVLFALGARVGTALKGPLPPVLLAPIPTPMGDMAAAVRLAWASDALLLAAAAGAVVTAGFASPLLMIGMTVIVAGVVVARWRRRR